MKKNKKNDVITGLAIVLGITLLGGGVLYLGGKPIYDIVKADFTQTMVNGGPKAMAEVELGKEEGEEGVEPEEGTNDSEEATNQYGRIQCESIGLDVPLYLGDTKENLLYGAAIYSGGGMPGDGRTVLISAHDSTYFKPLENIAEGAVIEVSTKKSKYQYKVREIKTQKASDGFDVDGGHGDLVLYTCYPFGVSATDRKERFFVYCDVNP